MLFHDSEEHARMQACLNASFVPKCAIRARASRKHAAVRCQAAAATKLNTQQSERVRPDRPWTMLPF